MAADDLFTVGAEAHETKDDYSRTEFFLDYRNHRRSYYWPWEESAQPGLDWGIHSAQIRGDSGVAYQAQRLDLMVGKRFSPVWYAELWGGVHRLDADKPDSDTAQTYKATLFVEPLSTLLLRAYAAEDLVYREGVLPDGVSMALLSQDRGAAVTWRAVETVRVQAEARQRNLGDGNRQQRTTAALLYGISPSWPWIWAGVGAEWLSYDRDAPGYWSPREYLAYGLRFEGSFPVREDLNGSAALNLNTVEEGDKNSEGYYLSLGLDWRVGGDIRLRLSGARAESLQRGSSWYENSLFLGVSGALR